LMVVIAEVLSLKKEKNKEEERGRGEINDRHPKERLDAGGKKTTQGNSSFRGQNVCRRYWGYLDAYT